MQEVMRGAGQDEVSEGVCGRVVQGPTGAKSTWGGLCVGGVGLVRLLNDKPG